MPRGSLRTRITAGLGMSALAVAGAVAASPSRPVAVGVHPVAAQHSVARHPSGVVITAIGDLILGNTPTLPAQPRRYLRPLRAALTDHANIVFANLEGVLTNRTANKCGGSSGGNCFAFRNPPSFAHVFADVGFTVLNSANNHSHDYFSGGAADTTAAIATTHMTQVGVKGRRPVVHAAGRRVAILAYAPYNETPNLHDPAHAARQIRAAKKHADIVIVYMHAGAEGSAADHVTGHEEYAFGEDRGNPKAFAHRAIRAGASLVIASGPHVLRGMEFYRGHLIAYSLGDSASYHNFNTDGTLSRSVVLRVTLGPHGRFRSGRLTSVRLVDHGRPVLGGDSIAFVRQLSKDDFGSHAARLSHNGTIRQPA
ncbi:MAG: CapA family protein [Frankiales bacterium]|nr:CapA family protein [Frankiales bacterium]